MQVPVQEDQRKRLPLKKSILQMNCLTIHFHQLKLLANNMNVHAETGRRRLKKANFMCARPCKRPLLTPLHIEQRLAWAHSVERWCQPQWDDVLFYDESSFKIDFADWMIRIWRKRGESYDTKWQNVSNSVISMLVIRHGMGRHLIRIPHWTCFLKAKC